MKIQHLDADGQRVRIAVRAGYDDGVPLLLINGIGDSLEALQPFVDALDPALTVIRFDVPGARGRAVSGTGPTLPVVGVAEASGGRGGGQRPVH